MTGSYAIKYEEGTLSISRKPVTITAESDTKVYDATALTRDDYTYTELADGDRIDSVTVTGSQIVANKSDNVASEAKILNKAGEDVTDSYAITYVKGELEVTPKALTITADSDTKVYDATALTKDSYTNTALAEGDRIASVTVTGSQTVFGDSNNVPSAAAIMNANDEDVTDSYDITYVNGKLSVTKKTVTITADSAIKQYDSTALTKASFTKTDLAAGDSITATITGSQTVAGKSENVPSDAVITNTNGDDVTGSYEIGYANGTLEVTKKPVTITADSDTKVYDATALTKDSYTSTDLAGSDRFDTVAVTGSQTNAGSSSNVASGAIIININNEDVTNSYSISYVDGELTVKPKKITIKADDKTMIYGDDEPDLTSTTVGLEGSDYIQTILSREEGNDVDTYTITVEPVRMRDSISNYEIELIPGTLTIQPRPVTVTAADKTKTFNTADPALTATVTGLATGESEELISYTLSRAAGENVGEYAITPAGKEEQGNYQVTYVPGTLEIVTVDTVIVKITAKNGTYKYDGTEKDISGYDVEINNELYKATDFTFNGSAELKARNAGTYRTGMKASDFVNTNANFDKVRFEVTNGTLTITPRSITLTSGDAEKPYDGTALTNSEVTETGDGFVEGEGISITVTGRRTSEGEGPNTFTYAMTGDTREGNYDIKSVYGVLKVTKIEGELVVRHKLTIHYLYEDGTEAAAPFVKEYMEGEAYSKASAKIKGYNASETDVKGIMGTQDIDYTVTYSRPGSRNESDTAEIHTLTVRFISYFDNKDVSKTVSQELAYGDPYTIFLPAVEGYKVMKKIDKVTGNMPNNDITIKVYYLPEDAEDVEPVELDNYGTPLGVADSILGGGEIIE